MKYTQERDEFGTTQQERETAKLLGVDKMRQIDIAREQGISRQRVGQLKEMALTKNLISVNGNGYDITDYGKKVLGLNVLPVSHAEKVTKTVARTNFDKKFEDIVEKNNMSDMFVNMNNIEDYGKEEE